MHQPAGFRVVPLALVLFTLASPATAQPSREGLFSALLERLGASLASVWEKGRAHIDPDGSPAPAPSTPLEDTRGYPADEADGRAHIDPDG